MLKPDILFDCPAPYELRENMTKRLKSGSAPVSLCMVAMMCLGSTGYSVNHVSITGVTDKQMLKVWSYLERQAVASGRTLRQWMKSHMSNRTCKGYMARWGVNVDHGDVVRNTLIMCQCLSHFSKTNTSVVVIKNCFENLVLAML